MKKICYYHHPCMDGFTSAWILQKHHPDAEFIGVDHDRTTWPQQIPENATIFILDFTFDDMDFMRQLIRQNKEVIHLDHHETAKEMIDALTDEFEDDQYEVYFRLDQSGAHLTWEYFNPTAPMPYLISRVEDRDLWLFRYHDTKAFCEGLRAVRKTFANWEKYNNPTAQMELYQKGQATLRPFLKRLKRQIERTRVETFLEMPDQTAKPALITRATRCSDFSEQTNMMLELGLCDIAVAFQCPDDGNRVRFRVTTKSEGPHAGFICKYYGGGGHPNTGGFETDWNAVKNNNQGLEMAVDCIFK